MKPDQKAMDDGNPDVKKAPKPTKASSSEEPKACVAKTISSTVEANEQQCLVTITPSPQFCLEAESHPCPVSHPITRSLLYSQTTGISSESVPNVTRDNIESLPLLTRTESSVENLPLKYELPSDSDEERLKTIAKLAAGGPKVRNRRGTYECKFCGKVFPSWTGRYYHMPIHTGKWKHVCVICDKKFMRTDRYDQHIEKHRQEHHQMQ